MKGFTKIGRLLLVLSVLALLPFNAAISQDFIMESGTATYNATCSGVIKMKSATGTIVRNNSNPLGTDSTNAIKGIVDWASTDADQVVQALYYERLFVSGGAVKDLADGIFVTGSAACATVFTDYADLEDYPFAISAGQLGVENDFLGDFTYLGGPVSVFPVTGDDAYLNLILGNSGGGPFTIEDGDIVSVDGTIELPDGLELDIAGELNTGLASNIAGDVTISGDGQLDIGGELITFNGTLDLTGNGELNGGVGGIETNEPVTLNGAGAVINVGTGDLTFNDDLNITDGSLIAANDVDGTVFIAGDATIGADGNIDFGDNTELEISGTIDNDGNGSNLLFACSSIVTYNGTVLQTIMPTINTNPYGNLVLSGGEKVGGIVGTYPALDQNNIAICEDFSLADGNLDMLTNGGYVNMLNETSAVNYTDLAEVVGSFRRQFTTSAVGPYTFNNSGTALTFAGDVGFAPDAAGFFQLNIEGGENPLNYEDETDVNRRIIPSYGGGIGDFEYTLQVAYLQGELPSPFQAGLTESDLKFFEADAALPAEAEKLAGTGYTRTPSTPTAFGLLSMSGIVNGTDVVNGLIEREFTSGHDLVLRANNLMYSIVDGRWSNPNVWDEGRIPEEDDNVEVRTLVYVGIDGPFAGTTGGTDNTPTLNTQSESTDYGTDPAANTIRIGNFANASLIIGNEDNAGTYVHKTKATGTAFTNLNTNTTVVGDLFTRAKGDVVKANVNGLWLTTFGTNPAVLGTAQIQNEGAINNQGIIEIGE